MNKAYNIVWSHARQVWIVASELTRSCGRPALARKSLLSAMVLHSIVGGQTAHANQNAFSSQIISGSVVGNGVMQSITSDWHAIDTTITSGGVQQVDGGLATSTTIDGGYQYISAGGSATQTTINTGIQYISAGGSATQTTIHTGIQKIFSSGSATQTTINGGIQHISAGGSATQTTINDSGVQLISNGGSATSTTLNDGRQTVIGGGSVAQTTINSGGLQNVYAGASATQTTVNGGGQQNVYGGSVTDTTLNGGGSSVTSQIIYSGGSATLTTVNSGGGQVINEGGMATDTTINSVGYQYVSSGGSANSTTVNNSGHQYVYGGSAVNTTVNSDGFQFVDSSGSATFTTVNNGGHQHVYDGSATNTTVNNGGEQIIYSGGSVTDTTVNSGAQYISSGGSATQTTINNGGQQNVFAGGSATLTTVNSGGLQNVSSGGAVTDTTVNGGTQYISSGGSATQTTINNGGLQNVSSGGSVTGTTVNNGGHQYVYDGGTTTDTVINTGGTTWLYDGAILADDSATVNGTLVIDTQSSRSLSGDLTGSGTLLKTGGGLLTLSEGVSTPENILLNAGTLNVDADVSADTTSLSNTTLILATGRILTGSLKNGGLTVLNDAAMVTGDVVNSGTLMLNAAQSAASVSFGGNLTNNGSLILGNSTGTTGSELSVTGDYVGNNGTLVMNTVLGTDNSLTDKLIIGGNASGKTDVTVNNLGGEGDQTVNGIEIVQVGGTSESGAFYNSKAIRAGLYNYTVVQKGNNFYLTSDYSDPEGPGTPEKDISTAAGGYISNLAAANQIFVTRLADREGGTAYINPVTGERDITSLWLRQEGGHNRSRADSLQTTGNRYVAQLGGELVNGSFTEVDRWDIGLMAGYANQKSTTTSNRSRYNANTKSQLHGYSAGLYGTWYQDAKERTGLYVDSWVQYSWFRNSVSEDGQLSDSYKSQGFSASLESGYSWKVVDGERTDFFIQPQAQLVWSGIKADSHYTQNGIRVQGQGENNLQSRLGLKAYLKGHGKLDDNTGRSFKPFVEANWIHNTERYGVRMDGDSLNQDGAKDIAEVKTGMEAHLTPSTSLWGSVGVQMGDKGYSDTQGQLGLKVRF
ncbi:TPA: autotransporter outer membrane beta-barrel domain-containing protein [Salmonella enterica]|nr:autotransporter outer membrane beta-barrel domain-containing protein [Salmonella enterica]HCL5114735.1 autotransporter outer membrane beta-barrel domain-containing protein [Salmonella enterica]